MDQTSSAPWLPIPPGSVLAIEHPCIVENVDKAIEMLGGADQIAQSLDPDFDKPLGLKFQPHDPTSRATLSYNNSTDNLLLKFTVPKRTGRKRKRGTADPFIDDPASLPSRKDAAYLIRSLQDNPQNHAVDVVGSIRSSHIWRNIPDFVYSAKNSSILDEVKDKLFPQQYPLVQKWRFPQPPGSISAETFPPPILSTQSVPLSYTYRQNPAVKTIADPVTGKKSQHNNQKPIRLHTYQCQHSDEAWPDKPHPQCIPLSQQPRPLQDMCRTLSGLFEQRPLWTRRALINQLPNDVPLALVRHGVAYVCFAIRSGPWRDTLCKFGVDPRRDPSLRKLQTVLVQLVAKAKDKTESNREEFARMWVRSADKNSHVFTGSSTVPPDGKSWQLCDLLEPHLKTLVDVSEVYIRHQCETRYFGWYANGTMAKIRVTTKALVDALLKGEPLEEASLTRFLALPEDWQISESASGSGYLPKDATKKEAEWASAYRSLCRTMAGSLPTSGGSGQGRLSKPKSTIRGSFIANEDGKDAEEDLSAPDYETSGDDGDGDNDGQHAQGANPVESREEE